MTPLEPLEIYVLDCFRERGATRLNFREIVGDCTVNRHAALRAALSDLESRHGMLQRASGARNGTVELTALGKRYIGMAEAEGKDRF